MKVFEEHIPGCFSI